METYHIAGKNQNGEDGSWEIQADNESDLKKILTDRAIEAKTINGEVVKKAKPKPQREIDEDGV